MAGFTQVEGNEKPQGRAPAGVPLMGRGCVSLGDAVEEGHFRSLPFILWLKQCPFCLSSRQ